MNLLKQFARWLRSTNHETPERVIRRFQKKRAALQKEFLLRASQSGRPRGLRWAECQWQDTQQLLRERLTGTLTLLIGINVQFEAIEGGDMEDVAAVSMIRDASAVFHYSGGAWKTAGRTLFNMNPESAAVRLVESYEPVPLNTAK
jgi:hypothetical protein